jgi:hypothetical protein
VVYQIGASGQSLHRIDVATVSFLELDSFGEIVEICPDHVVAAGDVMPFLNECVGEMAAKKSGGAGNEHFHLFKTLVG